MPAQIASHQHPHELVGALEDLEDLRVAHHALDRTLPDVAHPAHHLDGIGRHAHGHVTGEALRLGRDGAEAPMVVLGQPRGVVDEAPGGLDLDRHVGEHELHALERRDRLTELTPLARVARRVPEQPERQSLLQDEPCDRPVRGADDFEGGDVARLLERHRVDDQRDDDDRHDEQDGAEQQRLAASAVDHTLRQHLLLLGLGERAIVVPSLDPTRHLPRVGSRVQPDEDRVRQMGVLSDRPQGFDGDIAQGRGRPDGGIQPGSVVADRLVGFEELDLLSILE